MTDPKKLDSPHWYNCPDCGHEFWAEEWGEEIDCPSCGGKFTYEHSCNYNEETGDSWCDHWLEKRHD